MILGGRKITVQRRAEISDGQGGFKQSWTNIGIERGKLRPASSGERMIAGQQETEVSHVAYLRADAAVEVGDRLELNDVNYEVIAKREPGMAGKHVEVDLTTVQP